MEVSSSHLPLRHSSPLHSSSSFSFLPLALPNKTRASSLIAKAELQDSGDGPSSGDAAKKATGFGTAAEPTKKKRGKWRGTIIRRSPIERSSLLQEEARPSDGEQSVNENASLLTWLVLGLLILVEGIALAVSGFLPEEWDNFFVKFLYPSFTPMVFLFVAGTIVYGVFKCLQGEKMKS